MGVVFVSMAARCDRQLQHDAHCDNDDDDDDDDGSIGQASASREVRVGPPTLQADHIPSG